MLPVSGRIALGRLAIAAIAVTLATAAEVAEPARAGQPSRERSALADRAAPTRPELARGCFALRSVVTGGFVALDGAAEYRADGRRSPAARFDLKPAGPRTYLLHDHGGGLLAAAKRRADRTEHPRRRALWRVTRAGERGVSITARTSSRRLAVAPATGALRLLAPRRATRRTRFRLIRARDCTPFPEARVNARGRPFRGTRPDGAVRGIVDTHLHVTAELRAGGRVLHGRSFHRLGITRALGGDARVHGPDGSLDVTGNLLRTGIPFGGHDTDGWPSFAGWPTNDTNTHQQTYYRWLKRTWKAGMRLVVAQAVEDEPLCRIEPVRSHSCDEAKAIRLQVRRLRGLERYVDAQSGGRGRGWLRLVYGPAQARRAIERGQLAVLIGAESSNLFGCSVRIGEPQCTRADIDRGIDRFRRLGVRSVFVSHWVDNAYGGAAISGGAKGAFINVFNAFQTGRFFATEPCPERRGAEMRTLEPFELAVLSDFFPRTKPLAEQGMPDYPPGPRCNVKGLTGLGAYLIRKLIANGMLIDADHMSAKAKERVLRIAERHDYPLVSSHTGTGGGWRPAQLRRLRALGGFVSATPGQAPGLAARVLELRAQGARKRYPGVGFGSDTGGFSTLPGPRDDAAADPLAYPFRSADGAVTFRRQRTGDRVFDLNTDGVAHYGLFADLFADMERSRRGERALRVLFRSAEAYLRTWGRATRDR